MGLAGCPARSRLHRGVCSPGGTGWAQSGPRSHCSGGERVLSAAGAGMWPGQLAAAAAWCGEAQESLNPGLGRRRAMVRCEETEGPVYFFFQMRGTCTVLFPPSLTGEDSSAFQVFLLSLLLFINNSLCFRSLCGEKFWPVMILGCLLISF